MPLSRLIGATPTSAAILRCVNRPSSGNSAIRVMHCCRADAGHAVQQIGIGLPSRGVADRLVDVFVKFGQFGLQHSKVPFDGANDLTLRGPAAPIALGDDHLDDLAVTAPL